MLKCAFHRNYWPLDELEKLWNLRSWPFKFETLFQVWMTFYVSIVEGDNLFQLHLSDWDPLTEIITTNISSRTLETYYRWEKDLIWTDDFYRSKKTFIDTVDSSLKKVVSTYFFGSVATKCLVILTKYFYQCVFNIMIIQKIIYFLFIFNTSQNDTWIVLEIKKYVSKSLIINKNPHCLSHTDFWNCSFYKNYISSQTQSMPVYPLGKGRQIGH